MYLKAPEKKKKKPKSVNDRKLVKQTKRTTSHKIILKNWSIGGKKQVEKTKLLVKLTKNGPKLIKIEMKK